MTTDSKPVAQPKVDVCKWATERGVRRFMDGSVSVGSEHMTESQFLDLVEPLLAERDALREALRWALDAMHEWTDEHDGKDYFQFGCGNCLAGTPTPHSPGCKAEALLRGGK